MTDTAELALVLCLALSAAAWLYLIFLHGGFWRDGPYISANIPAPRDWPSVVAVIPARNEAETIAATLTALAAQDYPGAFAIILVDDQSEDGTQERARDASGTVRPLRIVAGTPLPKGWTGKMWAVAQGIDTARSQYPDAKYLFLTDADIAHGPSVLRDLVAKAERDGLALVSHMVLLRSESLWEKLLIPAFIYFFKKLYPFPRINDPRTKIAGAAGGCMLVQREVLDSVGGIERIKHEIIDDCALARILKPISPIWLGLTRHSHSLRRYDRFADIWGMVTRTAFVQLRHSLWLLAGTVCAMTVIYIVPPAAAIGGLIFAAPNVALSGFAIWAAMAASYIPTVRLYRLPVWYAMLLPLAAMLYTAMTIGSAYRSLAGQGPSWKDRRYGTDGDQLALDDALSHLGHADPMIRVTEIVKRSGTSFYWAMRVLPTFKRNAMFAVYAFCREVDDIADGAESPAQKMQELDIWQGEIDRLYDGNPTHLVTQALATPVETFGFTRADFDAVIAGMRMDAVDRLRIADSAELELYCDRVACAVGRLSCAVFGVPSDLARPLAKNLGDALQLTNILRDIHEDALRDHVYLPADLLRRHGCDAADASRLVDQPGLAAACREIAAIAEARFAAAEAIIAHCDHKAVRPALVMKAVYRDILNGLQRRGWDHVSTPIKRSKLHRYGLVARSLIFG